MQSCYSICVGKGDAAGVKELANDFGEYDYVTDPGFNGNAAGKNYLQMNGLAIQR